MPSHKRLIKGVLNHDDARPGGAWSARGQEGNTGGIWAPVYVQFSEELTIESVHALVHPSDPATLGEENRDWEADLAIHKHCSHSPLRIRDMPTQTCLAIWISKFYCFSFGPRLSSVRASSALNGNCRTDCCSVVLKVMSTRRFCARVTIFKFFRILSRCS
jgi:hypothetical protein